MMVETFDAKHVSLHVRKSNMGALHLYKDTLGYAVKDIAKAYYADSEDAYEMELDFEKKAAAEAAKNNATEATPTNEAGVDQFAEPQEAKKGRDFGAEKLARKAAEMPEVDPEIDLAALRAKAQGAKMSDEEKKARGLLYDTSIASAVRDDEEEEEDEGEADFAGGDPFDFLGDGEEEEAVAEAEKPKDAFDEGFEAYLKAQGLDGDDDDDEEEEEAEETEIVFGKPPTKGFPVSVNLHLQKSDGSVKVVITI